MRLEHRAVGREVARGEGADLKAAACADMLRDVAVAKGWLPEGSQPIAMWVEPEWWDLCLMVTHSSFDQVPEMNRPPVFRPERT